MGDHRTFRLLRQISILAALALFAFVLWANSFYTVSEQENAVLLTAGKYTDTKSAGAHLKIPFLQSYYKVNTTTRGMEVGYTTVDGSNTQENYNESMMITVDFNLVSVDFYIEWRVTNPQKSLFAVSEPVTLLRNAFQSSARDIVSNYTVDSVLTDGKSEIQGKIMETVNGVLDRYDIGLFVTNVMIQDAEPPNDEVKLAFKAVEDAKQQMDTMINEANRYYNENIPSARAEADKIVKNAEGVKESRINEANGQVARFNEMFTEYSKYPEITEIRMYYEAMEEILPGLKVIVDSSENNLLKMLDINQ
ncbi:MAG: FtsH protease activity modulator HflK [Clostridiales bacterium]|nr:FtsH protease activity modulator HflK [Clostridiales bacterium]